MMMPISNSIKGLIAAGLFVSVIYGLGWAMKIEPPMRQVVINQVGNGYEIHLCIQHTPCPITNKDTRIAKDAQGASAEVWAYLSGKGLRVDWREDK